MIAAEAIICWILYVWCQIHHSTSYNIIWRTSLINFTQRRDASLQIPGFKLTFLFSASTCNDNGIFSSFCILNCWVLLFWTSKKLPYSTIRQSHSVMNDVGSFLGIWERTDNILSLAVPAASCPLRAEEFQELEDRDHWRALCIYLVDRKVFLMSICSLSEGKSL